MNTAEPLAPTSYRPHRGKLAAGALRRRRVTTWGVAATVSCLLAASGVAAYAGDAHSTSSITAAAKAGACIEQPEDVQPGGLPPATPATLATLHQAYNCILDNAYAGSETDTRVMLRDAFQSITQELMRRDLDQPTASIANLTGHRDQDWASFAKAYQQVIAGLPGNTAAQQAVASAAVAGMLSALGDDHAHWDDGSIPDPGATTVYTYGFVPVPSGRMTASITDAAPPLYILKVRPGEPADKAGLKPGDIIIGVNDLPTVSNGLINGGVLTPLTAGSATDTVRLTVQRPATGKTSTVELHAVGVTTPLIPTVSVTLLPGGIAEVTIPAFTPTAGDEALAGIANLRQTTQLHGVIFNVRGNGGGRDEPVTQLISSLVHNKLLSKNCDIHNNCTDNHTDDAIPLLNLPITLITDATCASACEDFTADIKFLNLGKVIGQRTAGVVSGTQRGFALTNNTILVMPTQHRIWANGELVDTIGVPVDYQIPYTAQDISKAIDPGLDKARTLLGS
ncbi:S41 family peptidase [Catenulispora acidiphila]|uniref:S41 family peptidase n=1 Tax=Catenulispora acidiphila TaxID=304895 RepID=UPI0011807A0D|nr:S41 family peptidase [Catenulispora acidiphila]